MTKYTDLWNDPAPPSLVRSVLKKYSDLELRAFLVSYKDLLTKIENLRRKPECTYGELWLALQSIKDFEAATEKIENTLERLRKEVEGK